MLLEYYRNSSLHLKLHSTCRKHKMLTIEIIRNETKQLKLKRWRTICIHLDRHLEILGTMDIRCVVSCFPITENTNSNLTQWKLIYNSGRSFIRRSCGLWLSFAMINGWYDKWFAFPRDLFDKHLSQSQLFLKEKINRSPAGDVEVNKRRALTVLTIRVGGHWGQSLFRADIATFLMPVYLIEVQ